MALGALDANAQEQLAGGLGAVVRVGGRAIEIGRRVVERVAFGRQQLAGELVVGHVVAHGSHQPAIELMDAGRRHFAVAQPQQVAPFQGPEFGVLGPLQQCVDQLRTSGRIFIR